MKYIVFFAALIFCAFSVVRLVKVRQGTKTKKESAIKDTTLTTCKFSTLLSDVGETKMDSNVRTHFRVYNTGPDKLYLEAVLPDCHCTVANFSKEAINPEDSGDIELNFHVQAPGPFQASAVVSTNTSNSPTLLIFRGIVEK